MNLQSSASHAGEQLGEKDRLVRLRYGVASFFLHFLLVIVDGDSGRAEVFIQFPVKRRADSLGAVKAERMSIVSSLARRPPPQPLHEIKKSSIR